MNAGSSQPLRDVRPLPGFYRDLQRQLLPDGGPGGEPSYQDFLLYEFPELLRIFAVEWDLLPPLVPGRSDYRVLFRGGRLVFAVVVKAQLARDGVIELVSVDIETSWPESPEEGRVGDR